MAFIDKKCLSFTLHLVKNHPFSVLPLVVNKKLSVPLYAWFKKITPGLNSVSWYQGIWCLVLENFYVSCSFTRKEHVIQKTSLIPPGFHVITSWFTPEFFLRENTNIHCQSLTFCSSSAFTLFSSSVFSMSSISVKKIISSKL